MKAYPVTIMCRLLNVSRSGFYRFMKRAEHPKNDVALVAAVKAAFATSKRTYGSRRLVKQLHLQGHTAGRYQVRTLMRRYGLQVASRRRYRITTNSQHTMPVMPNVVARSFAVDAPNRVWAGDITYLWTRKGWLYLAVLLDLYSRRVVGWAIDRMMTVDLVKAALAMAVGRRQPQAGLIHHSDRGSQYASQAYQQELSRHGITCSMSRRGDCWDNAVVESFFHSLKGECTSHKLYHTRNEAKQDLIDYIEMFYNSQRLHSYLGYMSPNQYEAQTR